MQHQHKNPGGAIRAPLLRRICMAIRRLIPLAANQQQEQQSHGQESNFVEIETVYVGHKKCGSVTVFMGDRAMLYRLGSYPVRCRNCHELLEHQTHHPELKYDRGITASQGNVLINTKSVSAST